MQNMQQGNITGETTIPSNRDQQNPASPNAAGTANFNAAQFQQGYQMTQSEYADMVAKQFSQSLFKQDTPQNKPQNMAINMPTNGAPGTAAILAAAPAKADDKPRVIGKWIEYKTPEGNFYYYDSVSKKTQWGKPPVFDEVARASKSVAAAGQTKTAKNAKTSQTAQTAQKRRGTPKMAELGQNDGPASKKAKRDSAEKESEKSVRAEKKEEIVRDASNDGTSDMSEFSVLSHDQCVDMFRSILEDQSIAHDAEWAGILSDIIKDRRYSAIKTLGERKKIFHKYCAEQKKAYHAQRRQDAERRAKAFYKALEDSEEIGLRSSFSDVEDVFANDERFTEMKYSEKREEFSRYRDALRKNERERARKLYEENAPAFLKLLGQSEFVRHDSDWEKIKRHFVHEDCVKNLKALERMKVFKKHRTALREKYRRDKEAKKERERNKEKAFKAMLAEFSLEKLLFHSKSRWRDVLLVEGFSSDQRYTVFTHNETRKKVPNKIFERYCCDLEDRVESEKSRLKKFLRKKEHRVSLQDTVEELLKKFKDDAELPRVKSEHLGAIFLEMIAKAKYKTQQDKK